MPSDLNRLIALGGIQVKSPVQRFMETRAQMQQEERNRLADMMTREQINISRANMGLAREKFLAEQKADKMARYEKASKAVAPMYDKINQLPTLEEKQAAFSRAAPLIQAVYDRLGVGDAVEGQFDQWNQQGVDVFLSQYGEKKDVAYKSMLDKEGRPVQGFIEGGRVFDRYGNPQPTWMPAPRETAEGSSRLPQRKSSEYEAMRHREEDIYKLTHNLNLLKDFVRSEDFIGGTTGELVVAANSLVQQFKQFTGLGDIDVTKLSDEQVENTMGEYSALRKAAINGNRRASLAIELAFNIAKSFDRGGKVTDADFKFARLLVDASADREATITLINDYMKRSQKNYSAAVKLFNDGSDRKFDPYSDDKYRELYGLPKVDRKKARGLDENDTKEILKGVW